MGVPRLSEKGHSARYWSELPARIPGHYKIRTALGCGHVLQVSGKNNGLRRRATLYHIGYDGQLRKIWSKAFRNEVPGADIAKLAALSAVQEWAYDPIRQLETDSNRTAKDIDALRLAVDAAIKEEKE